MRLQHVFFFRGLNTAGRDHVQWGPLNFGPMFQHLRLELGREGLVFHPIEGMGVGSLNQMSERALEQLAQSPAWQSSDTPVHFLGHSAGGLIARLVLRQLLRQNTASVGKIKSLLTIATPHRGAKLAELCLTLRQLDPRSYWLMRSFGYDVETRREFLLEYTPSTLAGRLTGEDEVQLFPHLSLGSIVCAAPPNEWCLPLRTLHRLPMFKHFTELSDGLIERETQIFGEVAGEVRIDHLRQIGLFGRSHQFSQMCQMIRDYFERER